MNNYENREIKLLLPKEPYTKLSAERYFVKFMDIPNELFDSVEFISGNELLITFCETEEFCVEKYIVDNRDVLIDKNLTINYLNKNGDIIRKDTFLVNDIYGLSKGDLKHEDSDITIKIIFCFSKHDISTCKEKNKSKVIRQKD